MFSCVVTAKHLSILSQLWIATNERSICLQRTVNSLNLEQLIFWSRGLPFVTSSVGWSHGCTTTHFSLVTSAHSETNGGRLRISRWVHRSIVHVKFDNSTVKNLLEMVVLFLIKLGSHKLHFYQFYRSWFNTETRFMSPLNSSYRPESNQWSGVRALVLQI